MSEPSYNETILSQYLLGALPETETERLDELSFTDEEFAESLSVVENDLVDAYVRGELSDVDLDRFKSFYLASPKRREKVRFTQALHSWSEKSTVELAKRTTDHRRKRRKGSWSSGLFSIRAPAWQWGFPALALLLLVAGGILLIHNLRLRQQMTQTQALHDQLLKREQELKKEIETQRSAATQVEQELSRVRDERARLEEELKQQGYQPQSQAHVTLRPPMRGAAQIPAITIRPETSLVAIQLELDALDYSAYSVALSDPATSKILWRSGSLKPRTSANSKILSVRLPARLLEPQNYTLRVSGLTAGATEIVGDYPFKVTK